MGVADRIEHEVQHMRLFSRKRRELKKVSDGRRQKLIAEVNLTDEQKAEIDDIYLQNYGKKIPYDWHRLYTAYTGQFDARYFPEMLYIPRFEFFMNHPAYAKVFADKNLLPILSTGAENIKVPQTILSCCNGVFRNEEMEPISEMTAVGMLKDAGEVFVKPTVDSCSGANCRVVNFSGGGYETDGKERNISEFFEIYGKNFIVSERKHCSRDIAAIYPHAVNTFRVITYIWNGKVNLTPTIMRIGQGGSVVDNAHAGGMFIGISDDGVLKKTAFTEFRDRFDKHPDTGVLFENYRISGFKKVLAAAQTMHARIPQIGVINWDFTLDENECPVLIEINSDLGGSIWMTQMANGVGPFGENLEGILCWIHEMERKWRV